MVEVRSRFVVLPWNTYAYSSLHYSVWKWSLALEAARWMSQAKQDRRIAMHASQRKEKRRIERKAWR